MSAAASRVHGDRTMSINSVSPGSSYNASQSPLQSPSLTKHRKHASVSDVNMQSAMPTNAPAASGQPGSKVNITA
jgi:hypothetical protein